MQNNQDSKIAFTKDILKTVSKELGISESKVKSVYDSQVLYLKHLANETDAVAIFIPFIGTLHIKVGYVFRMLKQYTKNNSNKKKLELFKSKKAKLDSHIQELIVNKNGNSSRHLEKNKINRFTYNAGKNRDEIEDIQNKR